jgi:hypothetical protein
VILVIDGLAKVLRRGHVVDFAVATVAAVGLWAVGLSEISWAPFFVVAVSASTRGGCLVGTRQATRS